MDSRHGQAGILSAAARDEPARGKDVKVTLYGQEKDSSTAGLARMNLILHDYATAEIKQGNALASPLFTEGDALKAFDYVVANLPCRFRRSCRYWDGSVRTLHVPRGENAPMPAGLGLTSSGRNFNATKRPSSVSSALYTTPIPPPPNFSSTR